MWYIFFSLSTKMICFKWLFKSKHREFSTIGKRLGYMYNIKTTYWIWYVIIITFSHYNRMKILLSVNWNISECPWMLTECALKSEFKHCSMTFQWAFSPTECCWKTGTTQWQFSIYFLFWEEIFCLKNELKNARGQCRTRVSWFYTVMNGHFISKPRDSTYLKRDILFLNQEILHIWNGIILILICIYFSSLNSSLKVSWLYYCCDGGSTESFLALLLLWWRIKHQNW